MMLYHLVRYVLIAIVGLYLLAVVIYAVPMFAGVRDDAMAVTFDKPDPGVSAEYENGLTAEQRETFYHLSQGSEILPWALLTAVDDAQSDNGKPFVENLGRFGLLPDPARSDGLPIGLTLSSNDFTFGMQFAGITCAACHVGELHHDGKAVRVDGAPNMFNMQLFYSQAVDALTTTLDDRGRLWRAAKRLGRQDYERTGIAAPFVRPLTLVYIGVNLLMHRDRLDARRELIAVIGLAKEQRDPDHPTSGFGRLDAFDGTRNFLFTRLRKADAGGGFEVNRTNMVQLDAAVKFPPLWSRKPAEGVTGVWGFRDYDWVEWTMNTNTVMERNITETLGAGATVVLDPERASLFESSIPVENLHELEWLAYDIDPPRWPEEVFGPIDQQKVAAGQAVFTAKCAGCHEYDASRRTEAGLIRLRGLRPETTATDPVVAQRISCPVPDVGALQIEPVSFSAEQASYLKDCAGVTEGTAFEGYSFARTVEAAVAGIKNKAYAAKGVDAARQAEMEDSARRGKVRWRDTMLDTQPPYGPYAARPLYGIWAAAPFLHNGSVPTLHDLLLPPDQRPKVFAQGDRIYDPVNLGFAVATDCNRQDCLVDTSRTGDGNGGHLWGTELSEPDRMALLEYLKTY